MKVVGRSPPASNAANSGALTVSPCPPGSTFRNPPKSNAPTSVSCADATAGSISATAAATVTA
jgi:hypothetical protein